MNLDRYIDEMRGRLEAAAEAGGQESRAVAQRLTAAVDPALRLMLLDALSAAAAEITRELAPRSVELRLRAGEPEFAVTPIRTDRGQPPEDPVTLAPDPPDLSTGEGGIARVNLRLPDQLKNRVEQAADREGLSINAWLVRAVAGAVARRENPSPRRVLTGGQRYTGWGR